MDDDIDRFIDRFFERLDKAMSRQGPGAFGVNDSPDPEKHDRHCEIADAESLLLIQELMEHRRRLQRAWSEVRQHTAAATIAKEKLFRRLEEVYPETYGYNPNLITTTWQYWRGRMYFCADDRKEKEE